MTPLNYYYARKNTIELVTFNKYTIDTNGVVRSKKTGKTASIRHNRSGYKVTSVLDDAGKNRGIYIGRAIASTFRGPPPTPLHTADHVDRNRDNDNLYNIRWATKKEQCENQKRPKTLKSASIIVNNEIEKTAQEWVEHLKDQKNPFGRNYTTKMIDMYARRKQHGFVFKKYSNLPGEVWKEILGTAGDKGRWEISNMSRVKWINAYSENVLEGERLCLQSGYPSIVVGQCHILAFKTFFPDEYASKKPGEMILHEDDDRLDFRPHKLRIGTRSENGQDAHKNGKHDGTNSVRVKCASYINDVFEKEYESQSDAVRYLKSIGFNKAFDRNIGKALSFKRKSGESKTAYGRTWKLI